jgi:regulator of RNase E activity RraA
MDLLDILLKSKKPTVLVIKQDFPAEILPKVGLSGGQFTTALKACKVTGVVTDGPTRDIDEIRQLGIQYLTSGLTPGHGEMAISAINVPVTVAGMDVAPGELIHMDQNGAVKFPADRLGDICNNIEAFSTMESRRAKKLLEAKTIKEIKAAWHSEELPGR